MVETMQEYTNTNNEIINSINVISNAEEKFALKKEEINLELKSNRLEQEDIQMFKKEKAAINHLLCTLDSSKNDLKRAYLDNCIEEKKECYIKNIKLKLENKDNCIISISLGFISLIAGGVCYKLDSCNDIGLYTATSFSVMFLACALGYKIAELKYHSNIKRQIENDINALKNKEKVLLRKI